MKNNKKAQETQDLRIAVLGRSLVGKSALTYRFINDRFPTDHDTTIEDQYRINLNIEGVECMLGNTSAYIRDPRYSWARRLSVYA